MFGDLDPKLPSGLLTGKERVLDPTTMRSTLGLGTMATQNANNVNISGGSANLSQVNATYHYGSYSYISYLYPYQVQSSYDYTSYLNAQYATIGGQTWNEQTISASGAQIQDNVTLVFVDATNGGACSGTPSSACDSYSDSGNCTANNTHGGCAWSSVYCPSYNGDQSNCNFYHCTWEMASCNAYDNTNEGYCQGFMGCTWNPEVDGDCYPFTDQGSCQMNMGCTWNPEVDGDCSTFNGDQTTCQATTGCTWNFSDCSAFVNNESACNMNAGCSWMPAFDQPCSVFNNDQTNCAGTAGCTWDSGGFDCHSQDATDQATCEGNAGCAWDDGSQTCFGTCSGMYYMGNGSCSGQYNTSCSGMYLITAAYCSGSYLVSATCDGIYSTNNCVSSGFEGYCYGTPTCQPDYTYCTSESGCSWTTGLNLTMPNGADGKTLRVIKTDTSGNAVNIYPYPGSGWTLRGQPYITLSTPYQDAWLSAQAATTQWF